MSVQLEPGFVLADRYTILSPLGSGGHAHVYLAEQRDLKRRVAVKVLKWSPTDAIGQDGEVNRKISTLFKRFEQEGHVVAQLRDPHTITMFDYGRTPDGLMYMVFEYIDGQSLKELFESEGRLEARRVVKILTQILYSLQEAHALGLLHRDIKPQNIMVYEHVGRADQVKLLDFGIAKMAEGADDLTAEGALIGTPRYIAPERIRGDADLRPASDLYSVGLVGLELLTGERVLDGLKGIKVLRAQLRPESLSVPPDLPVPGKLRYIINRMIRKPLDERYTTAAEVLHDLEYWSEPHVPSQPWAALDPSYVADPNALRAPSAATMPMPQSQLQERLGVEATTERQTSPDLDAPPEAANQATLKMEAPDFSADRARLAASAREAATSAEAFERTTKLDVELLSTGGLSREAVRAAAAAAPDADSDPDLPTMPLSRQELDRLHLGELPERFGLGPRAPGIPAPATHDPHSAPTAPRPMPVIPDAALPSTRPHQKPRLPREDTRRFEEGIMAGGRGLSEASVSEPIRVAAQDDALGAAKTIRSGAISALPSPSPASSPSPAFGARPFQPSAQDDEDAMLAATTDMPAPSFGAAPYIPHVETPPAPMQPLRQTPAQPTPSPAWTPADADLESAQLNRQELLEQARQITEEQPRPEAPKKSHLTPIIISAVVTLLLLLAATIGAHFAGLF